MTAVKETELGLEQRCSKCAEWWPLDREFWHIQRHSTHGFTSICRACRTTGQFTARIDDDRIFAMLERGRSVPDIALAIGVSVGAVYKRQRAFRERRAA